MWISSENTREVSTCPAPPCSHFYTSGSSCLWLPHFAIYLSKVGRGCIPLPQFMCCHNSLPPPFLFCFSSLISSAPQLCSTTPWCELQRRNSDKFTLAQNLRHFIWAKQYLVHISIAIHLLCVAASVLTVRGTLKRWHFWKVKNDVCGNLLITGTKGLSKGGEKIH